MAVAELEPLVVELALFGSRAARYHGEPGTEPADLDVLVVVTEAGLDRGPLYAAADRAQQRLGRPVNSTVTYLADALFLVVREGNPSLLVTLHAAVQRLRWPLFFGRKAFVPARPMVAAGQDGEPLTAVGLVDKPLDAVLSEHPRLPPMLRPTSLRFRRGSRFGVSSTAVTPESPPIERVDDGG